MKRTAHLASLVLVGALALSACGDGDDEAATSGDPVDAASQATGTAGEAGEDPASDDPRSQPPGRRAQGDKVDVDQFIADLREGVEAMTTAHLTMDMDLGGQAVQAEGDLSYVDGYRADLSMTMPGLGDVKMILIDSVMYLKSAPLGAKFVELDLRDPDGPLGPMAKMFEGLDPATQLEQFRSGITSIRLVGEERLQGEAMRHYVITLDPSRVEQLRGQPGVAGLGRVTYDGWFDSEHRLRQVEMTMPRGAGSLRTTVTDLGKEVDIVRPPASQVAEAPQM